MVSRYTALQFWDELPLLYQDITISPREYTGDLVEPSGVEDPNFPRVAEGHNIFAFLDPFRFSFSVVSDLIRTASANGNLSVLSLSDQNVIVKINTMYLTEPGGEHVVSPAMEMSCTREGKYLMCGKSEQGWDIELPIAYSLAQPEFGTLQNSGNEWALSCFFDGTSATAPDIANTKISCDYKAATYVTSLIDNQLIDQDAIKLQAMYSAYAAQQGNSELLASLDDFAPAPTEIPSLPSSVNELTAENDGLKLLFRYCTQCHGPQSVFEGDKAFLRGDSEQYVLATVGRMWDKIKVRIERDKGTSGAMPAPASGNYEEFHSVYDGRSKEQKVEFIIENLAPVVNP
jgi:mono/diheme cytochrome c family protein